VVDGPKEDINKTVVRPAIDLAAIQQQVKAQKKAAPKAARPATGKPQPRQVVEKAVEASPASDAGLPVMLIVGIVAAVVLIGAAAWYFLA
jgi:cobalamin biosynthesis Mg chelatase CobN